MDASEVKESSPKTHGKLKQNNSVFIAIVIYIFIIQEYLQLQYPQAYQGSFLHQPQSCIYL